MIKQLNNRLLLISTAPLFGIFASAFAQSPNVRWTRSFGGIDNDLGF
jgi:hypothetical protein